MTVRRANEFDFYQTALIMNANFTAIEFIRRYWTMGDAEPAAGSRNETARPVQDLTDRRNEDARAIRNLLAAKLKIHPMWLGTLDAQAARHIYLFIQSLEGRKPFGRVRRQRAPRLTLD